jgi:CheY-like chemotaxis protein
MLSQRGYRVIKACSGEQALQLARAEQPDVILLDMSMPGMSGWEIAAELGRRPETDDIPIVILSVLAEQDSEREVPSGAVAGWLEKPLEERPLFEAVDRAINPRGELFKVLIVEDDPDLATVLTTMFERRGIEAAVAADGHEAIELSEQMLPDLLVLDVGLPMADGFEVVDWLRDNELLRVVPLVIYTARELDEHDRERLRLGASTVFLTKGRITPQDFEQRVTRLLGRLIRAQRTSSDEPEAHPASP